MTDTPGQACAVIADGSITKTTESTIKLKCEDTLKIIVTAKNPQKHSPAPFLLLNSPRLPITIKRRKTKENPVTTYNIRITPRIRYFPLLASNPSITCDIRE